MGRSGPHNYGTAEKIADSVAQVSVGDGKHICFVTTTGKVSCFGENPHGELGVTGGATTTPVDVPGFPDTTSDAPTSHPAVEVAVGENHTCARIDSGVVKCWGSNFLSQLGPGTSLWNNVPPIVVPNVSATALAAGSGHTCIIDRNADILCWGDNRGGQLATNASTCVQTGFAKPAVADLQGPKAKAIAASDHHTCAVTDNHEAYCLGLDATGELGHGDQNFAYHFIYPVPVTHWGPTFRVKDARVISTGRWHTCMLTDKSTLRCWGRNDTGQLVNGGREDSAIPIPPP